jgi:hypothetical protein
MIPPAAVGCKPLLFVPPSIPFPLGTKANLSAIVD